jgi:hypothetical protein
VWANASHVQRGQVTLNKNLQTDEVGDCPF